MEIQQRQQRGDRVVNCALPSSPLLIRPTLRFRAQFPLFSLSLRSHRRQRQPLSRSRLQDQARHRGPHGEVRPSPLFPLSLSLSLSRLLHLPPSFLTTLYPSSQILPGSAPGPPQRRHPRRRAPALLRRRRQVEGRRARERAREEGRWRLRHHVVEESEERRGEIWSGWASYGIRCFLGSRRGERVVLQIGQSSRRRTGGLESAFKVSCPTSMREKVFNEEAFKIEQKRNLAQKRICTELVFLLLLLPHDHLSFLSPSCLRAPGP